MSMQRSFEEFFEKRLRLQCKSLGTSVATEAVANIAVIYSRQRLCCKHSKS